MQPHKTTKYELIGNRTLIIYGKDSEYTYPKNVVIQNDNREKQWIDAPELKSEKMIHGVKDELHSTAERNVWVINPHKIVTENFWGKTTGEKAEQGYIIGFRGMKTIDSKEYAEIQVSDGGMYFEFQYLDLKSYEFLDLGTWGGRF